jgi:metal-responsive CopG/Arc/MetJ family transcriptional regulator
MSTVDIPIGDGSNISQYSEFSSKSNNIIGNMIIVAPNNKNILKKLNRIENIYKDQIVSKNQSFIDYKTIIYLMFNGEISDFQKIVVEINSIEGIKNFRYLIAN